MITRRRLLTGIGASAGGLALAGCDGLNGSESFRSVLRGFEGLNKGLQRSISARDAMAREFTEADLSPVFRSNGTAMPDTPEYQRFAAGAFADWRLTVDGLVQRPLSLSLAQVQQLPRRTQITRHDCVEGWSAIGKWTGAVLGPLLQAAGLRDDARFIVFHCMDRYGDRPYYESVDLIDAFHPQTLLAYGLNDRILPIPNGAPLRLRVERQLGYKHAKYIHRIEARASLADLYGGKGGLWEDTTDYEWYAGI
jgi:DMSO/TMAO reductase YedYZ molybdopterin-dependent catalytic subunit